MNGIVWTGSTALRVKAVEMALQAETPHDELAATAWTICRFLETGKVQFLGDYKDLEDGTTELAEPAYPEVKVLGGEAAA